MERRLTTILAADIVGFSSLIGSDEEGILALRRRHRDEVITPLLKEHHGRVANTAGDSWLIEFPSTVEALRFAIEGQTRIEAMNVDAPESGAMQYRIGINLGDVVAEGDDLLGDGVNIAARLEALAPAGGIVISRTARDQVRDRLDVDLHDLGNVPVKNIERPVRAFQVVRPGEAKMKPPAPRTRSRTPALVAMLFVITVLVGVFWWSQRPDFTPVDPSEMTLALPERPSIAVLPFTNLAGEASAEWISDGITENIISTLSLSPDMVVMGRATTFSYKGRQVAPSEVAKELGVRYVLSGSVQKSGDMARITAELSDAVEGKQLWSFREDSEIENIFDVQDRIAEKLFLEMQVSLTVGEASRTIAALSGDFETSVRVLQGRAAFQRFDLEGHREAIRIWTELHEVNPESPIGPYLLAWIPWQRVVLGISKDPAGDYAESYKLVYQALAMQEWGDPYSLIAILNSGSREYGAAITAANRAIDLSPGGADVKALSGLALYNSGEAKLGLKYMLEGMRLEPDYPEWLPGSVYPALMEQGRYDETISLAQSVLERDMRDARAHQQARAALAAAFALKGDLPNAQKFVVQMLDEKPDLTAEYVAGRIMQHDRQAPRPFHKAMFDAYVSAGLPRADN
ncbi:TolB amino-terminal domain-containing protein [Shimia gijangensis]|uniref:TolB amino-terminal domain-containing protein n=1 Tax=Shimia gijangensis TaxID=1470563 RepID=A0A1M6MBN6_9RHOB|nr:adenylate/guanylate cyclase domain-containing protein [Shimia gijangensis]SHJ80859.1 TolB amino-terminal domain-containing protein [Shimia gijangensis]